ncbi:MAG: hypothetical protein M9945_21535 [Aquamicrobium sp.]|uniref:hypothetical protein n=1 Tax=Aquamicrobium sp. TaxID=1872579 RepID=UPI00349E4C6B|nr:hypothetical protein [Aquamicrobium sp.]
MMHYKPPRDALTEVAERDRYRDGFAAVEASLAAVRAAKRAADESLRRAQEAPGPHVTTNSIFVALYDAHLRDREALFSALRGLDEARAALRPGAAEDIRAAADGRGRQKAAGG